MDKRISIEYNVEGFDGLCLITPQKYGDFRGFFVETYNLRDFHKAGIDVHFVQDNQSESVKGTLRGMHYQIIYPQTKLVRVVEGKVFDVVIDLRENSETYGKWYGVELSEENGKQLLIPKGFAHGFLALSNTVKFCYKVDDYYHPNDEGGIAWNDPNIGIKWPGVIGMYDGTASMSSYALQDGTPLIGTNKDQKWGGLKEAFNFTN